MSDFDTKFIKPFVDSTLNVLKLQCSVAAEHDKPFIKGKVEQPSFEIAGIIGITSQTFNGTIALCFPEKVYLLLMSNMFGETLTEITKDLQDGAAELLNIIYGGAKTVLNQQGYTIQKAIPTVVRGKSIQTSHLASKPVVVLPFKTPAGEFHVEISTEAIVSQAAA